jgi:hypothetical protein
MKYIFELIIHVITWCLFFALTDLTTKAFGIVGVFYLTSMVLPIVVLFVLNKFSNLSQVKVISYTYVVASAFIAPVIISPLFGINIIPLFVVGSTLGMLSFILSKIALYPFIKKIKGNTYISNNYYPCNCKEEEEEEAEEEKSCDCERCCCDCTGCEDCSKKESTEESTDKPSEEVKEDK